MFISFTNCKTCQRVIIPAIVVVVGIADALGDGIHVGTAVVVCIEESVGLVVVVVVVVVTVWLFFTATLPKGCILLFFFLQASY
jgi:fumarate reductase subunit D